MILKVWNLTILVSTDQEAAQIIWFESLLELLEFDKYK